MTEAMLDCGNGEGEVPGEYRVNSGGRPSCWVAKTAFVSAEAEIDEDACVFERARVEGSASIDGPTKIHGRARVTGGVSDHCCVGGDAVVEGWLWDHVWLYGDSYVAKDVRVWPQARIMKDGRIESTLHQFSGWGGLFDGRWTFYRGRTERIWVSIGYSDTRTPDGWRAWCDEDDPDRKEAVRAQEDGIRRLVDWGESVPVVRDW